MAGSRRKSARNTLEERLACCGYKSAATSCSPLAGDLPVALLWRPRTHLGEGQKRDGLSIGRDALAEEINALLELPLLEVDALRGRVGSILRLLGQRREDLAKIGLLQVGKDDLDAHAVERDVVTAEDEPVTVVSEGQQDELHRLPVA